MSIWTQAQSLSLSLRLAEHQSNSTTSPPPPLASLLPHPFYLSCFFRVLPVHPSLCLKLMISLPQYITGSSRRS